MALFRQWALTSVWSLGLVGEGLVSHAEGLGFIPITLSVYSISYNTAVVLTYPLLLEVTQNGKIVATAGAVTETVTV